MKICRFCQHSQETGDYCEACNAPFPADKLDFSNSSDILQPDSARTVSDDAQAVAPEQTSEVSSRPAEQVETPRQVETAVEKAEAPNKEKRTGKSRMKDPLELDEDDDSWDPTQPGRKKILYSAKAAGDTVFVGKKLSTPSSGNGLTKSQTKSGKTEKTVAPANKQPEVLRQYNGKRYSGEFSFALISLIFNSVAMLFTCGTGLLGFLLSLYALIKGSKLKKGTDPDPVSTASKVKIFAAIADGLNAIWLIILLYFMFSV